MTERSFYKKWARPAALWWTLLIFILCFLPGKDLPEIEIPLIDKWTHLILFAVFSFLWLISNRYFSVNLVISVFLASVYLGWIIEYIQGHFIPDRTQDNMDTAADIVGSIAGIIVYITISYFHNKRRFQS